MGGGADLPGPPTREPYLHFSPLPELHAPALTSYGSFQNLGAISTSLCPFLLFPQPGMPFPSLASGNASSSVELFGKHFLREPLLTSWYMEGGL